MIILLFYQGHLKKAADITKAVGKVILIKYCGGLFFVTKFGPVGQSKVWFRLIKLCANRDSSPHDLYAMTLAVGRLIQ
jgi:hypothetical protein